MPLLTENSRTELSESFDGLGACMSATRESKALFLRSGGRRRLSQAPGQVINSFVDDYMFATYQRLVINKEHPLAVDINKLQLMYMYVASRCDRHR